MKFDEDNQDRVRLINIKISLEKHFLQNNFFVDFSVEMYLKNI